KITGSRESVNFTALVYRDLRDQVGSSTKAINPDAPTVACFDKRSEADKACTQQRSRLSIRIDIRYRDAESLIRGRQFGVSAITCVPSELRAVTQILQPGPAIFTHAAGAAKPGDTNSISNAKS